MFNSKKYKIGVVDVSKTRISTVAFMLIYVGLSS